MFESLNTLKQCGGKALFIQQQIRTQLLYEVIKSKSARSLYGRDEHRLAECQDVLGGTFVWEAAPLQGIT